MTATVTELLTAPGPVESDVERARRKAGQLAAGDLLAAARLLYTAQTTHGRLTGDTDLAARIGRVRADLLAVMAGEDTPSEIAYGDLAADASAALDEMETLREELETLREN